MFWMKYNFSYGDNNMGQIKITKAPIEGLYVIEPTVHGDNRGYYTIRMICTRQGLIWCLYRTIKV